MHIFIYMLYILYLIYILYIFYHIYIYIIYNKYIYILIFVNTISYNMSNLNENTQISIKIAMIWKNGSNKSSYKKIY